MLSNLVWIYYEYKETNKRSIVTRKRALNKQDLEASELTPEASLRYNVRNIVLVEFFMKLLRF